MTKLWKALEEFEALKARNATFGECLKIMQVIEYQAQVARDRVIRLAMKELA